MENFWLTFKKDVFIWTKGEDGLIYNAELGLSEKFHNSILLNEMIKELKKMANLYRILIDKDKIVDEDVNQFIKKALKTKSGIITENTGTKNIPVSFVPVLKIQNDLNFYRNSQKIYKDKNVITNCNRLIIHVNCSENGNNDYAKQTIFPLKNKSQVGIPLEELKNFINSLGTPYSLSEIILTGCVWEYKYYYELLNYFSSMSLPISVYCTEEDYIKFNMVDKNDAKIHYCLLKTDYSISSVLCIDEYIDYNFIVTTEEEYEKVLSIVEVNGIKTYRITPIYTKENHSFFENYVYITEDDLLNIALSKQDIFANQAINSNYFGTLTILFNGEIFTNLNNELLGTIQDSFYNIVYRELTEGSSWLNIRKEKPCCDCIYQWLCPSPSHYEDVIGKPNLCHIKP